MSKKGELIWGTLVKWIIGIGALLFGFVLLGIATGKFDSIADNLKGVFGF